MMPYLFGARTNSPNMEKINRPLLKEKAVELAQHMGKSFEPSDSWFSRFTLRHGLKFKNEHGEKQSSDQVSAANFGKEKIPHRPRQFLMLSRAVIL